MRSWKCVELDTKAMVKKGDGWSTRTTESLVELGIGSMGVELHVHLYLEPALNFCRSVFFQRFHLDWVTTSYRVLNHLAHISELVVHEMVVTRQIIYNQNQTFLVIISKPFLLLEKFWRWQFRLLEPSFIMRHWEAQICEVRSLWTITSSVKP